MGYFLLTGKRLFDGDNFVEVCSHQLSTVPVRPGERKGEPIPRDLEDLIMSCLEKEREKRPPNVGALREALLRCDGAHEWTGEDARLWWEEYGEAARKQAPVDPSGSGAGSSVGSGLEVVFDASRG